MVVFGLFKNNLGTIGPIVVVEIIEKGTVFLAGLVFIFDEVNDFFLIFAADINKPIVTNRVDFWKGLFKEFKFFF